MKKFLGVVSLIYSGLIIYVLLTNILKNYLAPNMHIYIKVAIPMLIIMGLVLLFSENDDSKFKMSDLFLLLPVVMLLIGGNGKLGVSLASNRIIDTTNKQGNALVDESDEEEVDEKDYDLSNIYFEVEDDNYNDIASYITYSSDKIKYENYTIRLRGMILKNNSLIPDKYFIIGKYQISCCAADAKFSFYYAKYDKSKLKDNTWYQIEGVLKPGKDINKYDIMYVDVKNIKEIDEKDEEYYVYPCYYYDEKCPNVLKYNFSY